MSGLKSRLGLAAILLLRSSAAVARVDPHVAVRAKAGLPASSAEGEVRLSSEGYLSGGGAGSLVARQDPAGRWIVSSVTEMQGERPLKERRWRLDKSQGAALEGLLDDPPSVTFDLRWRGRQGQVFQNGGPWGAVKRVGMLLTAGHD